MAGSVSRVTRRAVAIALGVVAAAALVVIATPRIPPVWSLVWGIGDMVTGGVEERQERLVDHPFPTTLAPRGYRLEGIEEMVDPDGTKFGVQVWFAGPDDTNAISYYTNGMTAADGYGYWKRGLDSFGRKLAPAQGLGPHSFCDEGDLLGEHSVSCTAAFDGMAVIADSVNAKPGEGDLQRAVALLRAGVEHWESIKD
jgi:hypothetical protein